MKLEMRQNKASTAHRSPQGSPNPPTLSEPLDKAIKRHRDEAEAFKDDVQQFMTALGLNTNRKGRQYWEKK